ncbi:MAG: hypothetical protein GEV06_09925 [Luteitalea sp.]|nr:hypothetical protein [Luteitalea sp.]
MIERCLMRPRALLDLLNHCRSVAINLRHERIEESDFRKGVAAFSADLLAEIGLEIRDVLVEAENVLYEFIGSKERMPSSDVEAILSKVSGSEQERDAFLEILLWYGVLGLVRLDGEVTYIYSVSYDLHRLLAVRQRLKESGLVYAINPAFVAGLDVEV